MLQNKTFVTILFLVLIGGGVVFFKWQQKQFIAPVFLPQSEGPSKASLKKILEVPRLKSEEKVTSSIPTTSQECLDFWTELQRLDLNDFSYPPRLKKFPDSKTCTNPPETFVQLQKEYAEQCGAFMAQIEIPPTKEEWETQAKNCISALYFFRAGISTWQHRDEKLSEISNLPLLVDKLALEFSKMIKGNMDTTHLIAIAERMLEVDPHIYGAAKAVLMGRVIDMATTKNFKREDDAYWAQMETLLQRAQNLNRGDSELAELARMIRTRAGDPTRTKQEAEQMIAQNSNSSEGYRYLGYAYWKLGDRQASFRALEEAMRLAPNNSTLRETWEAIHKPNADEHSYGINVNLGIHFDDLLR